MSQINTGSKLLNKSENDILISLLPHGSTIQFAGVVDLSTTQEPDHSEWFEIGAGVIGFVRDATRRSYYIQFFNIVDRTITWEQEVYNDFKFQILSPCQMVFEGESSMISIVFSDEIECKGFCSMLANKVAERKARMQQVANRRSKIPSPTVSSSGAPAIKEEPESGSKPKKFTFEGGLQALKKSYLKTADTLRSKKKTTKLVIGEPEGFRHLNHIGFDPQKGFDLNKCDAGWKKLFSSLGINEAILTDTKKSNFIFEFVEKNGGIDKLLNEIDVLEKENKPIPNINNQAQPPPVASRPRAKKPRVQEPSSDRSPPPPPPPPSINSNYKGDDKEPNDAPTPPPPKNVSRKPRRKAAPPSELESTSSELSRSSDSMPPPPPPPPIRSLESPPPIQNRPSEVRPPPAQPPRPMESASSDPRDALLAAISKGATLKKPPSQREVTHLQSNEPSTLVESLASSLAKMRAVTAGDDDSDSNAEENEDEWST